MLVTKLGAACLSLLFLSAVSTSECNGTVSADGQCDSASTSDSDSVETSALVQSRLHFKGKISTNYDPHKSQRDQVKPHLREFLDEDTKFISGVPVFRYPLAHNGGMEPSALELKEQKDWILEFEDTCTDDGLEAFCSSLEGNAKCSQQGHPSEHGLAFVELLASEEELAALMKKTGLCQIDFAEPNTRVDAIPEIESTGGPPSFLEKKDVVWGLDRIDVHKNGYDGKYALSGGAGAGVTVYVADTGIRCSHQEFEDRCTYGADWTMAGGSKKECGSSGGQCGVDTHKHGTHCAGTIGGKTMGVANKVKLVALKVLGENGGSLAGVLGSVDYVMSKSGPRIWSASLGGKGTDPAVKTSIDKAVAAGVVISVAGGNDKDDSCKYSPAYVPSAITVMASDWEDKAASFTNMGECCDIYAPGVDIVAAGVSSDTATEELSGTSMACPHVSGAAAIILSNNPSATPQQVVDTLLELATPDVITGDSWSAKANQKLLYVEAGMGKIKDGAPPAPEPPAPPAAGPVPPSPVPPGPAPPAPAPAPPGPEIPTSDDCPPGEKGDKGPPGPKGNKGPPGPPGRPR